MPPASPGAVPAHRGLAGTALPLLPLSCRHAGLGPSSPGRDVGRDPQPRQVLLTGVGSAFLAAPLEAAALGHVPPLVQERPVWAGPGPLALPHATPAPPTCTWGHSLPPHASAPPPGLVLRGPAWHRALGRLPWLFWARPHTVHKRGCPGRQPPVTRAATAVSPGPTASTVTDDIASWHSPLGQGQVAKAATASPGPMAPTGAGP